MAERTIVGVDFSGAGEDSDVGNTWVTKGILDTEGSFDSEKGSLALLSCEPVSRDNLTEQLKNLSNDTVAALDFPFSVPISFAECLETRGSQMPALWQAASNTDKSRFIAARDLFVTENDELLRAGDLHVPGCYSCLHNTNPNMVPMTFRGMEMLHTLWQAGCRVPPLDHCRGDGATLLEVMPGAALNSFDLPYKGYKGGQTAFENRRLILRRLPEVSDVKVLNLRDFHEHCMFSDDALDSIVAAVVAGLWVLDESDSGFKKPSNQRKVKDAFAAYTGKRKISVGIESLTEEEAARKEGWIYVPKIKIPA